MDSFPVVVEGVSDQLHRLPDADQLVVSRDVVDEVGQLVTFVTSPPDQLGRGEPPTEVDAARYEHSAVELCGGGCAGRTVG